MVVDVTTSMPERDDASTVTISQPTVQGLPPSAHARRQALPSSPSGPQVSQQLALATIREEELVTSRSMIVVGRLVAIAALLALPFIGGSNALRIAVAVSLVAAIFVGIAVERRIATRRYDDRTMLALALSVSPAILIASLYFGIYSAVQLFPALALYFFSRREGFRAALVLYLMNAIAQGTFAALIVLGAMDDPGLFRPTLTSAVLVVGHLLVQLGFFGAFLLGRGSHRATRQALDKMQAAMMAAAQKEALLHEARQELDRALAIDAPGRFTDHTFGTYRLGHVIGRGGMGEVYEAFHVDTGSVAAVKLLPAGELGNPQAVERFTREVRAVRGLTSPHVVRVLASSGTGDEIPYLVMERLRGQDLAHHLRGGGLPADALDEMLGQVGAAVEEAWQQGIVHRDLKPQNLFLADGTPKPSWKVLDFGVAALDDHAGTLTQGKVVGTPAYMAPEQARGERVDHRADVYALVAIAYRWLTGRPVCSGKDLHTAIYQVVHVMPQRPGSLVELHEDVDAVFALGLVKESGDRFASVAEFRAALEAATRGELDPKLRRRAIDLVARHPWGAVRG